MQTLIQKIQVHKNLCVNTIPRISHHCSHPKTGPSWTPTCRPHLSSLPTPVRLHGNWGGLSLMSFIFKFPDLIPHYPREFWTSQPPLDTSKGLSVLGCRYRPEDFGLPWPFPVSQALALYPRADHQIPGNETDRDAQTSLLVRNEKQHTHKMPKPPVHSLTSP